MNIIRLCALAGVLAGCLLAAPALAASPGETWLPAWYASPEPAGGTIVDIRDKTLRQIVRVSAGGSKVRVRLSNAYGAEPLRLDDIRVARRLDNASGGHIDTASTVAVTFDGHPGVTIAPGAYALSDPLPIQVTADSDLAVSLYTAGTVKLATVHDIQRGSLYVAPGDQTEAADLAEPPIDIGIGRAFPWLAEVEVAGSTDTTALIAFGDSITDGYGITPDKGNTWPDLLSRRLHAAGGHLSIVNGGLSGNRLLHHGQYARFGDGALARFDPDVLAQPNVSAVIVLIGINDLGHANGPDSAEYVSAADMIDGLAQLAARAHERGLKIYAATLTPFIGTVFANYYSDEKETRRQAVNAWLRTTPVFDGLIDFDKALEDPAAPGHLLKAYDLGDHLHPNDAGAAAMAAVVPLELIAPARPGHGH